MGCIYLSHKNKKSKKYRKSMISATTPTTVLLKKNKGDAKNGIDRRNDNRRSDNILRNGDIRSRKG